MQNDWFPPRSPHCLIQEDLFPDEWLILVACLMLNQTKRKQVERILPTFIKKWPTPEVFLEADHRDVMNLLHTLGFVNKRCKNLRLMTESFLKRNWNDARELPGCGEYAGRVHDIFFRGIIGDEAPTDHALIKLWQFMKDNER